MYGGRLAFRSVLAQSRNLILVGARCKQQLHFPSISNQFHSLWDSQSKVVSGEVSFLHYSILNSVSQDLRFSSFASPQPNEKQVDLPENEKLVATENDQKEEPVLNKGSKRRRGTKRTAFSDFDSDTKSDLSRDDLVKLLMMKEELLGRKQKEFEQTKDQLLQGYAELQNVMERTKSEAENSKKFAIQNFAKNLLDVADNLDRASSVVKDSFSKIDASKDTTGTVLLLKTLLEGVEMTDKQLAEVFKKSSIEKYNPINEEFDPHRHNAIFQISDLSKPPGSVAVVLKAGYMLYDRVIRPAEVGVTELVDNSKADQASVDQKN